MGGSVAATIQHYAQDIKGASEAGANFATLGTYEASKQIYQATKGNVDDAKNAADEEKKKQREILTERKTQEEQVKADKAGGDKRIAARAKQRQISMMNSGRQGTILTSPLGIPGGESVQRKTLLGG
jgi:hypothetical protein